jgi:hypothetical protein
MDLSLDAAAGALLNNGSWWIATRIQAGVDFTPDP